MKSLLYLSAIAAIFFIAGCTGATNPDQIVFPSSNVSYAKDIEPYFALACVQCHDYGSTVDLSDWIGTQAIDVTEPYDTTCELVLVMYGKVLHPPINANDNQRQGIKLWVLQGCPNN
jgi:hypothetical protein